MPAPNSVAGGVLIRPKLSLGMTYFVGGAGPMATARLVSTGSGGGTFTTATGLDHAWFTPGAAVDVFLRKNVALRAAVYGNLSTHSSGYGGGVKLQVAF